MEAVLGVYIIVSMTYEPHWSLYKICMNLSEIFKKVVQ